MLINLKIAGISVHIEAESEQSGSRFDMYAENITGQADIDVYVSAKEIHDRNSVNPGVDERSTLLYLIYEKICDRLPLFEAFMLHAATLEYGNKAYAFCAVSGTGKSTHAELWRNLLGDKCRYINGDKPIIRITDGVPTAFGTPWNGKERRGSNIYAPLGGICFLKRGSTPSIRKLDLKEGLFRLIPAAHRPKEDALTDKFYSCVGSTVENVPMYELVCDISAEAAALSFKTMTGDELTLK